jgi:DNA-binding IclR family transcriptional regulator
VRPGSNPTVTSKALALLAAFDATHPELTLTEMAQRAGLTLSTAQRRAAELVDWGALERTASGSYQIGLRLWEVGALAPRAMTLVDVAIPFMQDLYVITREHALLLVREGTDAVILHRVSGRTGVALVQTSGVRFPLHVGAASHVLLAHAPADVLEALLAEPLKRYTPYTVIDPHLLRKELAGVRRQGFAVGYKTVKHDAMSVAAPVVDRHGTVIAAVCLVVAG